MFPLVFICALPYLLAQAGRYIARRHDGAELGADPMATTPAPAPAPDATTMVATAALGPGGAFLASPQGQAMAKKGLSRGLKLVRSAKKGNPKAKRRVKKTRARAAAGDPKAKKELALIKAGAAIDAAQEDDAEELDEEFEE